MRRRSRGICEGDAPIAAATETVTVTAAGDGRGARSASVAETRSACSRCAVCTETAPFRRRTVGPASAVSPPRGHSRGVRPSGLRGDLRGQLQRTSTFLTTTMRGTADSAWSARERVRAGHVRNHGVTDEGVPYRLTPPCAHRVPPSGRRCHDEAPLLSRGPPRRRPTFIPPIRSLSRPPRPISWERDSCLDGDVIQPPRGRPGRGTSADRRARGSHDALAAKAGPASVPGVWRSWCDDDAARAWPDMSRHSPSDSAGTPGRS
ncbi:oxygenase MpaB family protein [[Kitasatospora] papulosa]|uniref:oxygenase MpaB family protein n=1 Tax=[Kitasatospora] papulosa TaxID=1464011 RepID=UPI0036EFC92C